MNSLQFRVTALGAFLFLTNARFVNAQGRPGPDLTSVSCETLAVRYPVQRLQQGSADVVREMHARCPSQLAGAVAAALPLLSRTHDTALLARLLHDGSRYRSATIAQRALDLFTTANADEARHAAFALAARQLREPQRVSLSLAVFQPGSAPTTNLRSGSCYDPHFAGEPKTVDVTPVPAAFDTAFADQLRRIRYSGGGSRLAHALVNCVWYAAVEPIPPVLSSEDVAVRYTCDNKWYAKLTIPRVARAQVHVGPVSVPGNLPIELQQDRETLVLMPFATDLSIMSRGRQIAVVAHQHISCMAQFYRERQKPLPANADTLSGWQWRSRPRQQRPFM